MIRTELGGQAAASAGRDVLGCQKAAINRMLLAKADCLQTALAPPFFTRRQQQVHSGIGGAGRREMPQQAQTFGGLREGVHSWPLHELRVGAKREDPDSHQT